jgi:hypothetical protein
MRRGKQDFNEIGNETTIKKIFDAKSETEVGKNSQKKKKNKKVKIVWGIVILLLLSIIYNEILPFFILPREIQELNKNINLPFKFAEPAEHYDFTDSKWKKSDDLLGFSYMKDNNECFSFQGYPDLSSTYKFTTCWTNKSEMTVFGFHVGDSIDKAEQNLKKNGYKWDSSGFYINGRVKISLEDNGKITHIYIALVSTDWFHKGYYK